MSKGQAAIIALSRAMFDRTGSLPSMTGIFLDYPAPVVRNEDGNRILAMTRWGVPTPKQRWKPKTDGVTRDSGATNIRNASSPHWRRRLGVENRCVVPFSSFSEFNKAECGDIWFALSDDRPLAFFAGIWTSQWKSIR